MATGWPVYISHYLILETSRNAGYLTAFCPDKDTDLLHIFFGVHKINVWNNFSREHPLDFINFDNSIVSYQLIFEN